MRIVSNSFNEPMADSIGASRVNSDHALERGVETGDFSPAITSDHLTEPISVAPLKMAELLGSGRHGLVMRAQATTHEGPRDVAVKIPSGTRTLDHEAAALRQFAHPNVVEVLEGPLDNGSLILELCDEGTLAHRAAHRALSREEARLTVQDIVDALRPMHESGWVHGDITPANIGLRSNSGAALLDFATAHIADGSPVAEGTSEFAGLFRNACPALDIRSLAATMLASIDTTLDVETAHFARLIERCDQGIDVSLDDLTADPSTIDVEPATESGSNSDSGSGRTVATERPAAQRITTGPPPSGPRTRAYGPGPGGGSESTTDEKQSTPLPRWWPLGVVVAVATLIGLELPFDSGSQASPALPGAESLQRTTPAQETFEAAGMTWDSETGMIDRGDDGRFIAGRPGDLAAIADWNCDGTTTLGVYRPTTNNWFEFDSWDTDTTSSVTVLDTVDSGVRAALFIESDPNGCASPIVR